MVNDPIIERFYGALVLNFHRVFLEVTHVGRGWYKIDRAEGHNIPSRAFVYLHHEVLTKKHRLSSINALADNLYKALEPKKMVTRINLMSGLPFEEPEDTPSYLSPSSEAFWST